MLHCDTITVVIRVHSPSDQKDISILLIAVLCSHQAELYPCRATKSNDTDASHFNPTGL